jgi:hypothetical protein
MHRQLNGGVWAWTSANWQWQWQWQLNIGTKKRFGGGMSLGQRALPAKVK